MEMAKTELLKKDDRKLSKTEEKLFKLLSKKELNISVAESCTGGLICARLVNAPGISEYFKEGFVTYSNKAKRRTLEVSKSTLKKEGAISAQVAKEMALGAAVTANADIAVSTTGNAGPGSDEDKPVGLVYIGIYFRGKLKAYEYHFNGDRNEIREQAAEEALRLCIDTIKKQSKKSNKSDKEDKDKGKAEKHKKR